MSPFKPLTKEDAAHILNVCIKTIDSYVKAVQLPRPVALGRRLYWHPDVFFEHLDKVLKGEGTPVQDLGCEKVRNAPVAAGKHLSPAERAQRMQAKRLARIAA